MSRFGGGLKQELYVDLICTIENALDNGQNGYELIMALLEVVQAVIEQIKYHQENE